MMYESVVPTAKRYAGPQITVPGVKPAMPANVADAVSAGGGAPAVAGSGGTTPPTGAYTPPAFNPKADAAYDPSLFGANVNFNPNFDITNDPGYQARMDAARRGLAASSAATGTYGSGGAALELGSRMQDLASQEYNNAFNRNLQTAQYGQTEAQRKIGNLGDLANSAYSRYSGDRSFGANQAQQAFQNFTGEDQRKFQNMTSEDQRAFQNMSSEDQRRFLDSMQTNQNDWSQGMDLSRLGMQGTSSLADLLRGYTESNAGNTASMGDVNAGATMGANQSWMDALSGTLSDAQMQALLAQLTKGSTGSTGGGGTGTDPYSWLLSGVPHA